MNLFILRQSSSDQVPSVFTTVQLLYKAALGAPLFQLVNSTPVWPSASDHLQDSVSAVSPIHTFWVPPRASFNLTLSSAFRTTARSVWSLWQRNRAFAKLRRTLLKAKRREQDAARNSPEGSNESSQVIYSFFNISFTEQGSLRFFFSVTRLY